MSKKRLQELGIEKEKYELKIKIKDIYLLEEMENFQIKNWKKQFGLKGETETERFEAYSIPYLYHICDGTKRRHITICTGYYEFEFDTEIEFKLFSEKYKKNIMED